MTRSFAVEVAWREDFTAFASAVGGWQVGEEVFLPGSVHHLPLIRTDKNP